MDARMRKVRIERWRKSKNKKKKYDRVKSLMISEKLARFSSSYTSIAQVHWFCALHIRWLREVDTQ